MPDLELLTYKELGDRLGIAADSARHKARRRKWKVEQSNHPNDPVRVYVPAEVLHPVRTAARTPLEPLECAPPSTPVHTPCADARQSLTGEPDAVPLSIHRETVEAILRTSNEALAAADVRHQEQAAQHRADMTEQQGRHEAETARRLAERDTLHTDTLNRLQAQAASERSLWLERIDAAECRAERLEQRLDQVLDQLLAERRPWWRWFSPTPGTREQKQKT